MWDLILSVPDHCLSFFYLQKLNFRSTATIAKRNCAHLEFLTQTWFKRDCVEAFLRGINLTDLRLDAFKETSKRILQNLS